jgi:hypothetical protein
MAKVTWPFSFTIFTTKDFWCGVTRQQITVFALIANFSGVSKKKKRGKKKIPTRGIEPGTWVRARYVGIYEELLIGD